jgi:hypothetical protein
MKCRKHDLLRRLALAALCASILPLPALAQTAAQHGPVTIAEQYLFSMANQERAQRNIQPLAWDEHLAAAAQQHAQLMAKQAAISHQFPGEPDLESRTAAAGARYHLIAENVAMAGTPEQLHTEWMHSPGHRANLLQPQENAIGIAVVQIGQQLWAVEDFSTRVVALDLHAQEEMVAKQLHALGMADVQATDDARKSCAMSNGHAGTRTPYFVMRYTTADLTLVPGELKTRIATDKRLHHAEVGSCAPPAESFTNFSIAILLYP